jgi:iron complex outermembrane receptor protein
LRKHRNADTGAISAAISYDPTKPIYIDNQDFGGYYQWLNPDGTRIMIGAPANPVALLNQKNNRYYTNEGIGNIKFNYELPYIKGLNANLVLGLDHGKGHGIDETKANSWTTFNNNYDTNGNQINYGYKGNSTNKYQNKLLDFYLNYKKDIEALDGDFEIMGGYSYNDNQYSGTNNSNLQNDPDELIGFSDYFGHENLQSFFGRANVSIKNKYLITATFRRDGSSRFYHSNEVWGNFPSLALAWKVSNEKFMSNSQLFNNLKIRFGWGKTGQQDIGISNPALATYLLSNDHAQYQFGNDYIRLARAEAYNPLLKWESTSTYNFGIDYDILNNKFSGAIEVFYRYSNDLLNIIPLPAGTSLSNEDWVNIGDLENKGIEFSLNYKAIDVDNKHLNFGFNTAYNTIEITKLTNSTDSNYKGVNIGGFTGGVGNTIQIFSVGYAPYSFYVYQQVYDNSGKPIEGVYVDRNGDGSIDSNDKYRFKKPNADLTFGFNTDFDYKNFDFNMFWRGSLGNYVYNNIDSQHGFRHQMLNESFPNVISNGVSNVLETEFENGGAKRYQSDYYVQDASFVKLDNLTIGYSLKNLKALQKIRLYASVQNVYTFTNYTGLDPEVFGGIDYNVYPKPRTFAFGLNVNF